MDIPLYNGRPVATAGDILPATDYIAIRRSSEVGDARHVIITPAEFASVIAPYVSSSNVGVTSVNGQTGATVTIAAASLGLGNVQNIALSAWTGSTTLSQVGTVSSGTWHGSVIGVTYGGTGVANTGSFTFNSNVTFTGGYDITFTGTAATNLTLPSGTKTLVSTTGAETLTNKTLTSPAINGGTFDTIKWDGSPTGGIRHVNTDTAIFWGNVDRLYFNSTAVNPPSDGGYDIGASGYRFQYGYFSNTVTSPKFALSSTLNWQSGSGTPEGAVTAAIGSIFSRTDGGANTSLYRKESGTGNTGWVAISSGGSFVDLSTAQTVGGVKTFTSNPRVAKLDWDNGYETSGIGHTNHDTIIYWAGTGKFVVNSSSFGPTSDNTIDLGSSGARIKDTYTATAYTTSVYTTQVLDTNGNELIKFTTTPSAVNEVTINNNATGLSPSISATGSDTNIDLALGGKGTGAVVISKASLIASKLALHSTAYIEVTASRTVTNADNGKILFSTASSDFTLTYPDTLILPFSNALMQRSTGALIAAASGSFTLRNIDSHTKTAGQWAAASVDIMSGTDVILNGRTA